MLKVLFITSSTSPNGRENVGDRVILAGARNLIAAAFGYYLYQEHGRWGRYEGDPDQFDLIVYAGMPQFGARGTPAREEIYFQEIIDRARKPVFMNIGGGTIHPIGLNYHYEADKMARSPGAQYYRDQASRIAYRTVRDLTSKLYFDRIGVAAELRCCPSFYSTRTIAPGAPRAGAIAALSNTTFVANRVRGDLGAIMSKLADAHPDFTIASHSGSDLGLLADMGRPHVFFRSEMALLSFYASVQRLFALRIHAAVPAWTMGARVVLGGFDNRTGLFDDVGMPVQWINMITESQASILDQFERLMEDDSSHVPLEKRQELVSAQLKRACAEVRAAAPDLISKASDEPLSEEGWMSHPPVGAAVAADDGFTLKPVLLDLPTGDEESSCLIVSVPAGQRASAASPAPVFPRVLPGKRFAGGKSEVEGTRASAALKGLNGRFGAYDLKLPAGRYALRTNIVFKDNDGAGPEGFITVTVQQDQVTLGERVIDVGALKQRGKKPSSFSLTFENYYAAMPINLSLETRSFSGKETLTLVSMEITHDQPASDQTVVSSIEPSSQAV